MAAAAASAINDAEPSDASSASAAPVSDAAEIAADEAGGADDPAAGSLREVTVAPGVPRYHNADCSLIRFMADEDLDHMTLAAALEAGCTPCRACLPD